MAASDILFANFAEAKIATPPSGTTGLSFSVQAGQGAEFPNPTGGKYFYGIFTNSTKTAFEVVKITARATDSLTIGSGGRGLDGTIAQTWTANDTFYYGLTAIALAEFFAHVSQTPGAHAASAISYAGAPGISATDVEGALDELDGEKFDKTGGSVTGTMAVVGAQLREDQGANIAAAATTDLGPASGNSVTVTHASGTLAITSLGGAATPAGTEIEAYFSISGGSLSMTHHATNLDLLSGANISLANGDRARFRKTHDSNAEWRMFSFERASGAADNSIKWDGRKLFVSTAAADVAQMAEGDIWMRREA